MTPRETQILELCAQGFRAKEIGPKLGISNFTVHTHIRNIYDRVGARNRSQAIAELWKQKFENEHSAAMKMFMDLFLTEHSPIVRWVDPKVSLPGQGQQVILWTDTAIRGYYCRNKWFNHLMEPQPEPRRWCTADLHPYANPSNNGNAA